MTELCPMTEKEIAVIKKLAIGLTRQEIAEAMRVSNVSVCHLVTDICRKAGIKRRDTLLVATAIRNGWIE